MTHKRIIALAPLIAAACTGEPPTGKVIDSSVGGLVSVGAPVSDSEVSVFEATSTLARGEALVSGLSAEDGVFDLAFPENVGPGLVCASGGAFVDPATNSFVQLGSVELCAYVPNLAEAGAVSVSVWSDLALALARTRVSLHGQAAEGAHSSAVADWRAFLSCSDPSRDPVTAAPAAPFLEEAAAPLDDSLLSGLLHAGLSSQAVIISLQNGYTPGVRLTLLGLLSGLRRDISADGLLDGVGASGAIVVEGYTLTADSLRAAPEALPQGIKEFLESDRNKSGVTTADLSDLLSCMAENTSPLFGGDGGGNLDIDPPVVTFLAPSDGHTVAAATPVSVLVVDASQLDTVEFSDTSFLTDIQVDLAGTTATLSAVFEPTLSEDGPVQLEVVAIDEVGNESTGTLSLVVDQDAPAISALSPVANATVSGVVEVRLEAQDAQGIADFQIVSPEGLSPVLSADRTLLTVSLDTLAFSDGPLTISAEASDAQGNSSSFELPLTIDNFAPGAVSGFVALETPVANANVQAFAYAGLERGALLGSGSTDSVGAFAFSLVDTYSGPVLLVASGTVGFYRSGVTGQPVSLQAGDELSSVLVYRPSASGTSLVDVQLNALTTMAAKLIGVGGDDAAEAISAAHRLIGEHLDLNEPVDIVHTRPSNLHVDAQADAVVRHRVALFHAGLARWGAETATEEGISLTSLPSIRVMQRLLIDLQDAVLNGEDAAGATVYASSIQEVALGTNTLRFDLATAVARWLERASVSASVSGRNDSGLSVPEFANPNGFLWGMSGNTSALFDAVPPIPFDQEGPSITSVTTQPPLSVPNGQPGQLPAVSGKIVLAVAAEDPSGVQSLVIAIPAHPELAAIGSDQFPTIPGQVVVELDTAVLPDGPVDIVITATDAVGAASTETLSLLVDNTAPTMIITSPALVGGGSYVLTGTASDATSGLAGLRVVSGGQVLREQAAQSTFAVPLNLPCDSVSALEVQLDDVAGNRRTLSFPLSCDDTPPTLSEISAAYVPASSLSVVTSPSGTSYTPNAGGVNTTGNWVEGFVLHKYANRLDWIEAEGASVQSNNLPVIRFSVSDTDSEASVYSNPNALSVRYCYFTRANNQAWVARRQWTELAVTNQIQLPVSLQTLGSDLITRWTDDHRVEIEVSDAAGNAQTYEFHFELSLLSPPVLVSSCAPVSEFDQYYDLGNAQELNALYSSIGATEFATGKVYWNTDLPNSSLMPVLNATFDFASQGRTQATEESYKVEGTWESSNSPSVGSYGEEIYVQATLKKHILIDPWSLSNNYFPEPDTYYRLWAEGDAAESLPWLNQEHTTTDSLSRDGSPLLRGASGFDLRSGAVHEISVSLQNPRFESRTGGAFDFGASICTVQNFVTNCTLSPWLGPSNRANPKTVHQELTGLRHSASMSYDISVDAIPAPELVIDSSCQTIEHNTNISGVQSP